MKIPRITGTIDRRILINFQVDREVISRLLPAPFRPQVVEGKAIAGICLIRLKNLRPKGLPWPIGVSSENGAHRIAVEWTENEEVRQGVYIPRRDTSSRLNSLVGGRLFPGVHHHARFDVKEGDGNYKVGFKSGDGTFLSIEANETRDWSRGSVFKDLSCASDFFRGGSVGYSPDSSGKSFDGLELVTKNWQVTPLTVVEVRSSFFEDQSKFPKGSAIFDNALLMRKIDHDWNSLGGIKNAAREMVDSQP